MSNSTIDPIISYLKVSIFSVLRKKFDANELYFAHADLGGQSLPSNNRLIDIPFQTALSCLPSQLNFPISPSTLNLLHSAQQQQQQTSSLNQNNSNTLIQATFHSSTPPSLSTPIHPSTPHLLNPPTPSYPSSTLNPSSTPSSSSSSSSTTPISSSSSSSSTSSTSSSTSSSSSSSSPDSSPLILHLHIYRSSSADSPPVPIGLLALPLASLLPSHRAIPFGQTLALPWKPLSSKKKHHGELRLALKLLPLRGVLALRGAWDSLSAGGSLDYPSWPHSPQYVLSLALPAPVSLVLATPKARDANALVCYVFRPLLPCHDAPPQGPLLAALPRRLSPEVLRLQAIVSHFVFASKYPHQEARAELELPAGLFILIPCTTSPKYYADYWLSVVLPRTVDAAFQCLPESPSSHVPSAPLSFSSSFSTLSTATSLDPAASLLSAGSASLTPSSSASTLNHAPSNNPSTSTHSSSISLSGTLSTTSTSTSNPNLCISTQTNYSSSSSSSSSTSTDFLPLSFPAPLSADGELSALPLEKLSLESLPSSSFDASSFPLLVALADPDHPSSQLLLLALTADPLAHQQDVLRLLSACVLADQTEALKRLLAFKPLTACLNLLEADGFTPLMKAALLNRSKCCKLLAAAGADGRIEAQRHETALFKAAVLGNVESFLPLLTERKSRGASRNLFMAPQQAAYDWPGLLLQLEAPPRPREHQAAQQGGGRLAVFPFQDPLRTLHFLEIITDVPSRQYQSVLQLCSLAGVITNAALIFAMAKPEPVEPSVVEATAEGHIEICRVLSKRGDIHPSYTAIAKLLSVTPLFYDVVPKHELSNFLPLSSAPVHNLLYLPLFSNALQSAYILENVDTIYSTRVICGVSSFRKHIRFMQLSSVLLHDRSRVSTQPDFVSPTNRRKLRA